MISAPIDPGRIVLVAMPLARIRAGRTDRVPTMVARLVALGVPIALDDVRAQSHGPSLGRPHVADALVAQGVNGGVIALDGKGETNLAKPTADGVREPLNRRATIDINF